MYAEEDTISSDPVTIILSVAGWIRSARRHEIDPASIAYRGEDSLKDFSRGRNNQPCVFIDAVGKCYTLPAYSLPSARGLGEAITGRVSSGSGVEFMGVAIEADSDRFVIVNSAGYGFIAKFSDMTSNKKTGKFLCEFPIKVKFSHAKRFWKDMTILQSITNLGKLLIFTLDQLPELAKGKGNKIIHIPKKQFQEHDERLSHFKTFLIMQI